jgi:hypothetical protein
MKKLSYLLLPVFAWLFVSCSAEEDIANPITITEVVTKGKWKVDLYMDANQDQTNDFAGYSFLFEPNGTLSATFNGSNYTGTWTEDPVTRSLQLTFTNATTVLERINDKWTVAELNPALINLSNNNPANEFLGIVQQ